MTVADGITGVAALVRSDSSDRSQLLTIPLLLSITKIMLVVWVHL